MKYKCTGLFVDRNGEIYEKEYIVEIDTENPIDNGLGCEDMAMTIAYVECCYFSFINMLELLDIKCEEVS